MAVLQRLANTSKPNDPIIAYKDSLLNPIDCLYNEMIFFEKLFSQSFFQIVNYFFSYKLAVFFFDAG